MDKQSPEPEPEQEQSPEPEPGREEPNREEMSKIFYQANVDLLENNYEQSLKSYIYLKEEKKLENPGLTHNLGLNCMVLKFFDKALEFFNENKEKYPTYVLSYLTEINCYIIKKEYQKAKYFAEDFISNFPMYPQIYFILATLYEVFEDEERAMDAKRRGMDLVKNLKGVYETSHYVQCYYENYTNKIYYMI